MKKMNKTILGLAVCACSAVSVGLLAACGDEPTGHTHNYGDWSVTQPTEEAAGYATKTCDADGCDKKMITVTLPALGDEAYTVTGNDATCEAAGEKTYAFANDGDPISFVVETPAPGHGTLEYTAASTASQHKASTAAYWTCPDCGQLFSDEEGTIKIDAVEVIPAAHPLDYVEGSPAACTVAGVKAHYYCEECDKNFEDENGDKELTAAEVVILALEHQLSSVAVTDATCYSAGEVAHYHCGVCGKNYADEDAENEIADVTIAALEHELSKVETEEATCVADGFEGYWQCAHCNNMFSDEEGTQKLGLVRAIPATGSHTWTEYPIYNAEGSYVATQCSVCHQEKGEIEVTALSGTINATNTTIQLGTTYYTYSATNDGTANKSVGMGLINYTLPAEGTYEIRYSYMDNTPFAIAPARATLAGATAGRIFSDATTVNSTFESNISAVFDSHNRLTKLVIEVGDGKIQVGTKVTLSIGATIAPGETGYLLINVTQRGEIYYGVNSIEVTAAGTSADLSNDNYKFVPTETQKYSITVPAGVSAVLSTGDEVNGGENGAVANFSATKNQAITFTFLASEAGTYNVTIGEEIPEVITLNTPLIVTMSGQKVNAIELGEGIVAGKTYKLTFTGGFVVQKNTGAGSWWFKINGEATYEAMNSDNATGFYPAFAANTGTTNGEERTWEYMMSKDEMSVTFTAQEGDILYLAIQHSGIPKGSSVGDMVLTLTEVTEAE